MNGSGTRGIARRGALVMASVTVGFLVAGCGQQQGDQTSTDVAGQVVVAGQSGDPVGTSAGPGLMEHKPQTESQAVASADSLPPEVAVSAADTLVAPGQIVEITAEGSTDVVEVVLWDGIGKRQPFGFDSASDLWRTFYRVPMRTPTEPLGLSVTAKNGFDRWRRVWVFLRVQREGLQEHSEPAAGK